MASTADIVLGAVNRAALSSVLTQLHRGGYGHLTRVFDTARGELAAQFRRAGVEPPMGWFVESEQVAVMVSAAARASAAAEMLSRHGADRVCMATKAPAASPFPMSIAASRMRSRRDDSDRQLAD